MKEGESRCHLTALALEWQERPSGSVIDDVTTVLYPLVFPLVQPKLT